MSNKNFNIGKPYYDDGKYLGNFKTPREFYEKYPDYKPESREEQEKRSRGAKKFASGTHFGYFLLLPFDLPHG